MATKSKWHFLNYSIPILAVVVIVVQFGFVNTQHLTKWKGGGFGMYSEIHYFYNQVHLKEISADSLKASNADIKNAFNKLKRFPSDANLKAAANLVFNSTNKDTLTLQVWKPAINSKNGSYTRVLINELKIIK